MLQENARRRDSRNGSTYDSEDDMGRQSPLDAVVASALARKKRQSLTLEGVQFSSGSPGSNDARLQRPPSHTSSNPRPLRTASPTSSTAPAVMVFGPGEVHLSTDQSDGPALLDTRLLVRSSSIAALDPAVTSAVRDGQCDLGVGGGTRKSALVSALAGRRRPVCFGAATTLPLDYRSISDSSLLSPFAPTFQPLPCPTSARPEPDHASVGNLRSGRLKGTATATRQPIGPAREDELVKMNFASRIRRRAVGSLLIGRLKVS